MKQEMKHLNAFTLNDQMVEDDYEVDDGLEKIPRIRCALTMDPTYARKFNPRKIKPETGDLINGLISRANQNKNGNLLNDEILKKGRERQPSERKQRRVFNHPDYDCRNCPDGPGCPEDPYERDYNPYLNHTGPDCENCPWGQGCLPEQHYQNQNEEDSIFNINSPD